MEVASPLRFTHGTAGAKRGLCSTGLIETSGYGSYHGAAMDLSDDSMQRSFKRRRFAADTTMEENLTDKATPFPAFKTSSFHHSKSILSSSNGQSAKRCRTDAISPAVQQNNSNEVNLVLEAQASEIENLKTAKSNLEATLNQIKSEHERVVNENSILKRAVKIQQERQQHAARDLEEARHFKISAEDQIKRLEQMIISLRYHLQAQQPHPGNDFMGFPPQPPDVF